MIDLLNCFGKVKRGPRTLRTHLTLLKVAAVVVSSIEYWHTAYTQCYLEFFAYLVKILYMHPVQLIK
ncbi:unnamed protein product [Parnassius mnemosyne]|uniref:Uncharacterized protein n=1 Tax=Parnassius mnemosyne TaxID=213953 RepID=A0AAV1LRK3_9NEOP